MRLINKIEGVLARVGKNIEINVEGRNVVILGGNGSGKTCLLRALFERLENNITQGEVLKIPLYLKHMSDSREFIEGGGSTPMDKINHEVSIDALEKRIAEIKGAISISYNAVEDFADLKQRKMATIRFFEADRRASIQNTESARKARISLDDVNIDLDLGHKLEQHFVNLKVRNALGFDDPSDAEGANKIEGFFLQIEKDMQYLFEDKSLKLFFDKDGLRILISQAGKQDYTFQSLSSGYQAILDVYADLIMRSQYMGVPNSGLLGVVIVDEIDVHLHVSLQRKILPFFTKTFPSLQFIVSTHSPFVLMSVDDALIYDLDNNRESGDVSMYSYEAVLEGLMEVPPVSNKMEKIIRDLSAVVNEASFDVDQAARLIEEIKPSVEYLDAESAMFYEIAVNKVLKIKSSSREI